MTTETLGAQVETEIVEPLEGNEPSPDRWVTVNALGLARQLIRSRSFPPGLVYALVAALPEATPPTHILFPDESVSA